jgi:hypothetical protein
MKMMLKQNGGSESGKSKEFTSCEDQTLSNEVVCVVHLKRIRVGQALIV